MHRLRPEGERVGVADHLRRRERHDVADHALLRRCAGGHPGQVDRVLGGAEVLRHVLRLRRAGRHLELDVGVLLGLLHHRRLVAERGREDDLVAVPDEALDHLLDLRALRDVLLERRLHLRAEVLLDVETALVVRLRPASVVVGAHVDPRGLERCGLRGRPRGADRHAHDQRGETGDPEEDQRELADRHLLLSPCETKCETDYRTAVERRLIDP